MKKIYPEQANKARLKEAQELLDSHTKPGQYNNMKWLKRHIKKLKLRE